MDPEFLSRIIRKKTGYDPPKKGQNGIGQKKLGTINQQNGKSKKERKNDRMDRNFDDPLFNSFSDYSFFALDDNGGDLWNQRFIKKDQIFWTLDIAISFGECMDEIPERWSGKN